MISKKLFKKKLVTFNSAETESILIFHKFIRLIHHLEDNKYQKLVLINNFCQINGMTILNISLKMQGLE